MQGISIYAGGFPDETYVMMLIQHNEYDRLNKIFNESVFWYLVAIALTAILGVIVQMQMESDDDKENKKQEEEDKNIHI